MIERTTIEAGDDCPCAEKKMSGLVARNIAIKGRRTSVRLEPEMWQALKDIARREKCTIHAICTLVAMRKRPASTLTAAIRVFVMLYYRAAATDEGHARAGHGDLGSMMERARVRVAPAGAPRMPLTAPEWGGGGEEPSQALRALAEDMAEYMSG